MPFFLPSISNNNNDNTQIEEGEAVWWYEHGNGEEEEFFTWSQIHYDPDPARREALQVYSYMVGIDTYASVAENPESDPSWFFNHSCDGNCWYAGDRKVVARRRILPGEEVHYDYALTETEASFHAGMECKCGSSCCRGVLKFDDYRKQEFWDKYAGKTTAHIAQRVEECGWLDSRLHVRRIAIPGGGEGGEGQPGQRAQVQKGVFALRPVKKGTLLAVFGGKTVSFEDAAKLEASRPGYPYLLQVESSLWQIPHHLDRPDAPDFINHSCAPNAGMADSTQLVALRDIEAGEEITLDYAMINNGAAAAWGGDNFRCGCGAGKACRGWVTARDWERKDVQDRLWPYFSPFVLRKVAAKRPDLVVKGRTTHTTTSGSAAAVVGGESRMEAAAGGKGVSPAGTPTNIVCISVRAG